MTVSAISIRRKEARLGEEHLDPAESALGPSGVAAVFVSVLRLPLGNPKPMFGMLTTEFGLDGIAGPVRFRCPGQPLRMPVLRRTAAPPGAL
jgi:hypothetical protein